MIEIPDDELTFRFSRSGGPGGQNVNKRSTKAELLFDVEASQTLSPRQRAIVRRRLASRIDAAGILHVVAQAGRTQRENRERATAALHEHLRKALAPPPKPRVPTKPSAGATKRRLEEKKVRSRRKLARRRPSIED